MDSKKIEEELIQKLTEGEMHSEEPDEAAVKKLPHPTEIRIQAQIDPVVDETRKFRQMAREVDDRYAKYDSLVNEPSKQEND